MKPLHEWTKEDMRLALKRAARRDQLKSMKEFVAADLATISVFPPLPGLRAVLACALFPRVFEEHIKARIMLEAVIELCEFDPTAEME